MIFFPFGIGFIRCMKWYAYLHVCGCLHVQKKKRGNVNMRWEKKTLICLFNLYSLPNQKVVYNKFKTHFKPSTSKITHSNWAPTFISIQQLSESESLSDPHPPLPVRTSASVMRPHVPGWSKFQVISCRIHSTTLMLKLSCMENEGHLPDG